MHKTDISRWTHSHRFETGHERRAERQTRLVAILTLVMMAVEITAGWLTNSMALLADGVHMATHTAALGIAAFAYAYARRHVEDKRFTFGTGKVQELAAFASTIILGVAVLGMVYESFLRLLEARPIAFDEALTVAVLGLAVNVFSVFILDAGSHDHHKSHDHHHDHNFKAAYLHVLADALTSLLAILALLAGKLLGWLWLDPLMGLVGAALIARWAWSLARNSGQVLLDMDGDLGLEAQVRSAIEQESDNRLADIHLWKVGPAHWAAILTVVSSQPQSPDHYKNLLRGVAELKHVNVEVYACLED